MTLAIDIETYSSVDLTKTGVRPYAESEDFEILLIGYQLDDEPVVVLDLTESDSGLQEFLQLLRDPQIIKTAFNASFERTCLGVWLGQELPPEEWRCTMVLAANHGLPMTLKGAGAALGLKEQKLKEGSELIRYFCKPCKPSKSNGGRTRNLPEHAPEKWELFKRYNRRDVEVEVGIRKKLAAVYDPPAEEAAAWALDQRINDRGLRIDEDLMAGAIAIDDRYRDQLTTMAQGLTGLGNPNSLSQLKSWLIDKGVQIEKLNKEALAELQGRTDLPPVVQAVLAIRAELGKSSVAKYDAMRRYLAADGRVHGLFQFYGANRTGRWAGRGVQLQNLTKNHIPDLDLAREVVKAQDLDAIELAYGSPEDLLSQLIRTAFIPSEPGGRIMVADYSAIEARVIAWLAGEEWVLEEFRGDGKIYEATASQMFGVPKAEICKGGPRADLRPKGKVAQLACGYGGGPNALIAMGALKSGISEDELPGLVQQWRQANPRICAYWRKAESAAKAAIRGARGSEVGCVSYDMVDGALFCRLPSGRSIVYQGARISYEDGVDRETITYNGVSQTSGLWVQQRTWGGKLTENIVQAVARDLLRDALRDLDAAGYRIIGHVHDEILIDLESGRDPGEELRRMIRIMSTAPSWAAGLPMNAAGFTAAYYMKD